MVDVSGLQRLQRFTAARLQERPKHLTAPSQDWGEDDGGRMRPVLTSGALPRPLPRPRQCLLRHPPRHPLWFPLKLPAGQEGGLAQPRCQSGHLGGQPQRPRRPATWSVRDVAAKSIKRGSISPTKLSWRTESTSRSRTPCGSTVKRQQVVGFSSTFSSQVFVLEAKFLPHMLRLLITFPTP